MRNSFTLLCFILTVFPALVSAQFGGGVVYLNSASKARAKQSEAGRRVLSKDDLPPSTTSTFVEASVLMNVKADEYVAVFALSKEGVTVAECNTAMSETAAALTNALKSLGITEPDLFLDFIAQTKRCGFEIEGNIAKEKLVGFELKKNLSIRFTNSALLEKLLVATAELGVHDLIKVDYIVNDMGQVQQRLMEAASEVIKQKAARYEKLLDVKLLPPGQIYAERSGVHYPSDMYDSYTAAEAEQLSMPPDGGKYTIQQARKSQTFFYNGLDADGFDRVTNPVIIEPVVQCTLYLKVKYEVEQMKAR